MIGGPGVRWDDLPLLRERAASFLARGPARSPALAERIFGLRHAPARLAASLVRDVLAADPRFQANRGRWLLRDGHEAYKRLRLGAMDFVVVDVETTGGAPARGDRLTEIAAIRVRGGEIVDSFESLVNPERLIPPMVTALTDITQEMVAGAPRFDDIAERLREVLEGAVFVAHNAGFDWRFLQAEFRRCHGGRLDGQRICTLRLARRLHPELACRSLRALTEYYAISFDTWHRAGPDARATAELFARFLDRLRERGVTDWGRLQEYLEREPEEEDEIERGDGYEPDV